MLSSGFVNLREHLGLDLLHKQSYIHASANDTALCVVFFAARAGWSSPVAREAHNLEVTGSNPVPAIKQKAQGIPPGLFCLEPRA